MNFNKTNRKIHKWGSIIISTPLLIVFFTGILLLLKKEFSVIQPPTMRGVSSVPSISFERVIAVASSIENADVSSWSDIDRLDVRPSKGIIKIRSKNSTEIQIDSQSGQVLQVATRRSDFIESIHDGTFFHKYANLWLMLPVALTAVVMLVTGVIMFFTPYYKKKKRRV